MHVESISRSDAMSLLPPTALEVELLELFAPTRRTAPTSTSLPASEHAGLWRADEVHRAKNMGQLSSSFADVAAHPSRRWLPPEVTAQARRLSRAYEELGEVDNIDAPVPCAALLTEVVTQLIHIFGRSREVVVAISADALMLSADLRRALVLMASELVINALKYGYPNDTGGMISACLSVKSGDVELVVEDDGIGCVETCSAGQGGRLPEQLRVVLGATVTRAAGSAGHGCRVLTSVPIDMPRGSSS